MRFSLPFRCLALAFSLQTAVAAETALLEQTNLFDITDGQYQSYRIPCLLALPDSTVLAFTSARKSVSDWADIDLMLRRSTDGGQTWEKARVIANSGTDTCDNPVAIWDSTKKVVHFLHQINYERVYYLRSEDGGKTFSQPRDITPQLEAFRKAYPWHVIATGPGHGIELKNGRLVVPVWLSPGEKKKDGAGRKHHPSVVSVIYSDDHGETWHCGDLVPDTLKNLNESVAVEKPDGGVHLFMRNEDSGYAVAVSTSKDGATQWSAPRLVPELYSPICFASVLRLPKAENKSRLLFANPDSRKNTKVIREWGGRPRENLTLKLSEDDGKTWPVQRVLEPGRSGYSDLAVLPDGTFLCLYERGDVPGHDLNTRFLTIARFNLKWLQGAK